MKLKIRHFFLQHKIFLVVFATQITNLCYGQNIPTSEIVKSVQLDSVMVVAARAGFNVEDFVDLVKNDTTFYQAFKNTKVYPHLSENNIFIYNKKQEVKASLVNTVQQTVNGDCRWMKAVKQRINGNFYNKWGEYNYYTPQMFAQIFWINDTVCDVSQHKSGKFEAKRNGGAFSMETHIEQLKEFMFMPGAEVEGAPLVGKKLAIFDKKMARFYDYIISSKTYQDSIDCYVFTVKSKPDIPAFKEGKVVVDSLVTFFNKKNFSIVARQYYLSYYSLLFDFNVVFDIQLQIIKRADEPSLLFPKQIFYNGFWDIPFRKPEIAKFDIRYYM